MRIVLNKVCTFKIPGTKSVYISYKFQLFIKQFKDKRAVTHSYNCIIKRLFVISCIYVFLYKYMFYFFILKYWLDGSPDSLDSPEKWNPLIFKLKTWLRFCYMDTMKSSLLACTNKHTGQGFIEVFWNPGFWLGAASCYLTWLGQLILNYLNLSVSVFFLIFKRAKWRLAKPVILHRVIIRHSFITLQVHVLLYADWYFLLWLQLSSKCRWVTTLLQSSQVQISNGSGYSCSCPYRICFLRSLINFLKSSVHTVSFISFHGILKWYVSN